MRSLLSRLPSPRRRHAACDDWAIRLRVDVYAAAYALERRAPKAAPTFAAKKGPTPLSRGSLAWACGDLRSLEVRNA
jgi:hypothetical protein